jgi:distribution and morphology protein 31
MPQYHRPTKEELLAAATGFWSRLKVRFKWLTIRSARPFNSDEIGALFSWVIFGHLLWIILGTTTFFSLAILTVNTVFAQETLARWVGNYLTKSSGMKVVFESAIVPRWRDGVITFKNVFISRRPGQGSGKVSKGSPQTAAAAAAASIAAERDSTSEEAEDTNYTQFDMTLDTVNVTLSFTKWFNGQGPLNDVEIKGVRGVIDRTSVHSTGQHVDPKTYRHVHHPGDFEIEHFKMEDFLVTVHQPGGFRPFSVSIFSCDLPQLRQRWLFYDFLCANTVSGSFDDSLFTIHPRQMLGHPNAHLARDEESGESDSPWKKHSRLRIDALKIDHLNRGTDGPFSWIHEGTVDLIADVMFPTEADDGIITKLMSEIKGVKALGEKLLDDATIHNDPKSELSVPATVATPVKSGEDKKFLVLDLKVNFHDVRAAVPLLTTDLSYVNYALIRPIVAYINSRKTFIPINCRVIKRADDFDGSWTLYDSGLLDDLSAEVSMTPGMLQALC